MDAQKEWEQKIAGSVLPMEKKCKEQGTSFDIDELGENGMTLQEKN